MQPFQQRVVEEKRELDEKIEKLDVFIRSEAFMWLTLTEQDQLNRQYSAMDEYSRILGERISGFTERAKNC
jgi:hypothetical protein